MLVTLLVLWVVVIPALTIAGTYAISGIIGDRLRARRERLPGLVKPIRSASAIQNSSRLRRRARAQRERDHALARH